MGSFKTLMPETKTSDIDCGWGETERMTYKPRQITYTVDEASEATNEGAGDEGQRPRLAEEICRVVTAWEMTGPIPIEDLPRHPVGSVIADGQPVPLEPAVLSFLPQPLLAGIVLGLTYDAQPDPTRMQRGSRGRGATSPSSTS